MSIALQPAPITTPVVDKQGKLSPLWSRYFVNTTATITTGVAPADAPYWIGSATAALTGARNLALLASGYLKLVVGAGIAVPSTTTTIPSSDLTGALPALDGSALTSLNASALGSGTVPDARLGSPLPALSGANLTNLTAGNLTGALPAISGAALTALLNPLPASSGVNLTALKGSNVTHQVVTKVFADSPYTVLSTDETVLVDATAGAVSITLPTPTSGRVLCVKKIDATASVVTLTGTVDGVVNPTLPTQYNSRMIQGDGSTWNLIATV